MVNPIWFVRKSTRAKITDWSTAVIGGVAAFDINTITRDLTVGPDVLRTQLWARAGAGVSADRLAAAQAAQDSGAVPTDLDATEARTLGPAPASTAALANANLSNVDPTAGRAALGLGAAATMSPAQLAANAAIAGAYAPRNVSVGIDAGIIRRNTLSVDRAPATATPTITVNTTGDGRAATAHNPATSWTGTFDSFFNCKSPEYTFLTGLYQRGSTTFPDYSGIRLRPGPVEPAGYGGATVEFWSDAPVLSSYTNLAQQGVFRVSVDGAEVYRHGPAIRTGTAQAGAASTMTLDSGASTTDGLYFTRYLRITSGTGAGQTRQITGYVGSTKVATVTPAWTTTPDSTSAFEIALNRRDNNNSTGNNVVVLDWNGERRFRKYRIESGGLFYGVSTAAVDTVMPAEPSTATPTFWCGDSFSAGTFSDGVDSMSAVACNLLGWGLINNSIGGTGYLQGSGNGATSMNGTDRIMPPFNSWRYSGVSGGGTMTFSQGGTTTAAIAYNATASVVGAAFTAAFGAGAFEVIGGPGNLYILGRANPTSTTPMTIDTSSLTGTYVAATYFQRYLGEMAPLLPRDGAGNLLPFNIVLANGHNDTTAGGYVMSTLTARVAALLNYITTQWPSARVFVIGNMYLPGGSAGAEVTSCNAAILAACQQALPKINGVLPFIDTLTPAWATGTGRLGNLQGNGNSDVMCDTDNVHPTPFGHRLYGRRIAQAIAQILQQNIPA